MLNALPSRPINLTMGFFFTGPFCGEKAPA